MKKFSWRPLDCGQFAHNSESDAPIRVFVLLVAFAPLRWE
jgi:hypothetical protein